MRPRRGLLLGRAQKALDWTEEEAQDGLGEGRLLTSGGGGGGALAGLRIRGTSSARPLF